MLLFWNSRRNRRKLCWKRRRIGKHWWDRWQTCYNKISKISKKIIYCDAKTNYLTRFISAKYKFYIHTCRMKTSKIHVTNRWWRKKQIITAKWRNAFHLNKWMKAQTWNCLILCKITNFFFLNICAGNLLDNLNDFRQSKT